jgi:hypothetical protein
MFVPDYYTTPDVHPNNDAIVKLEDQRAALYKQRDALEALPGDYTPEQEDQYDNLSKLIDSITRDIEALI